MGFTDFRDVNINSKVSVQVSLDLCNTFILRTDGHFLFPLQTDDLQHDVRKAMSVFLKV